MEITIKCICGNTCVLKPLEKKYFQVRDNLGNEFEYFDPEYKYNQILNEKKLVEIKFRCKKCDSWVTLGFD